MTESTPTTVRITLVSAATGTEAYPAIAEHGVHDAGLGFAHSNKDRTTRSCLARTSLGGAVMGDSGRDIQKRSFAFACEVINFCDSADDRRRTTEHLLLQLFDAGTSVAANLAEASAGQTKPDFIAKASVALKESREARLWLELIVATRHRLRTAALPLLDEARQLVSILTAIVKKARSNPHRGEFPD